VKSSIVEYNEFAALSPFSLDASRNTQNVFDELVNNYSSQGLSQLTGKQIPPQYVQDIEQFIGKTLNKLNELADEVTTTTTSIRELEDEIKRLRESRSGSTGI